MALIIGTIVLTLGGIWLLAHSDTMKKEGRRGDQIACILMALACFAGAYFAVEGLFGGYTSNYPSRLPLRVQ